MGVAGRKKKGWIGVRRHLLKHRAGVKTNRNAARGTAIKARVLGERRREMMEQKAVSRGFAARGERGAEGAVGAPRETPTTEDFN